MPDTIDRIATPNGNGTTDTVRNPHASTRQIFGEGPLVGDDLTWDGGRGIPGKERGSDRVIWSPSQGKDGDHLANEVILGDPKRTWNGLDAVIQVAVGVGLDTMAQGKDKRLQDLMCQLVDLAQSVESQKRYGRPERVLERRDIAMRELQTLARGYPDPAKVNGAVWMAAGELMANDCVPPRSWDDAVDPDCVQRGLRDGDGWGPVLIGNDGNGGGTATPPPTQDPTVIPNDGGGVTIPVPGGQRIVGYDFQLNVNAVRCRRTTESSDEFGMEGTGTYEADTLSIDRYEDSPFESVDPESSTGSSVTFLDAGDYNTDDNSLRTNGSRLFQVRVKYAPGRVTRISATLIPTEVELSDLQRMQLTAILQAALGILVSQGLSAAAAAAQAIPVVGQLLGAVITSDFVSDAVEGFLRPFVAAFVALFGDADMFTPYIVDMSFMWSDASRVPLLDYTITGTRFTGFASVADKARVPLHEIERTGKVTSFIETLQTRPEGPNRRRLGPGRYSSQFKSFALKTDFVRATPG